MVCVCVCVRISVAELQVKINQKEKLHLAYMDVRRDVQFVMQKKFMMGGGCVAARILCWGMDENKYYYYLSE